MVKLLLNFLLLFLALVPLSSASVNDASLKEEFGKDLTQAPFFLRFTFHNKYHKDWKNSNYSERKNFLIAYETDLAAQQAKEKAEAKAQIDKKRNRLLAKQAAGRKKMDRLKAEVEKQRAKDSAYTDRQKNLEGLVSSQERELQQMQQDFSARKANR